MPRRTARRVSASARNLEVFIDNNTEHVLEYASKSGLVGKYPEYIGAGATSSNIDFTHHDGSGKGSISYKSLGCSVSISVVYDYGAASDNCGTKNWNNEVPGACSLTSKGCTDHGCKCTYELSD